MVGEHQLLESGGGVGDYDALVGYVEYEYVALAGDHVDFAVCVVRVKRRVRRRCICSRLRCRWCR